MTVPCVIYGAKSTTDKHASIPEQITEAMAMAAEQGWTVVGTFSDEGFSAYSGNRGPGLEAAKRRAAEAAAENRTTAMLLAQAHDRFARGPVTVPGRPRALARFGTRCDG